MLCRHEAALDLTRFQCDLAAGVIDLNGGAHRRRNAGHASRCGRRSSPLANFIVEKDGRPLASCIITFRRARRAAGLSADVSPRVIWRTMANLLDSRVVPHFQIQAWMGQHAVNTTLTAHYLKPPSPAYLNRSRAAIPAKQPSDPLPQGGTAVLFARGEFCRHHIIGIGGIAV
jgi:hypothetical protein